MNDPATTPTSTSPHSASDSTPSANAPATTAVANSAGLPYRRMGGDVLTIGFATTAVMWVVKYIGRMPVDTIDTPTGPHAVPLLQNWLLIPLVGLILFLGAFIAGRRSDRGALTGLYVGLLAAALNLVVMAGLLGGDSRDQIRTDGIFWLVGSLLAGGGLGFLGGILGNRARQKKLAGTPANTLLPTPKNWALGLTKVTAFITVCMLALGGIVTGANAGLAVEDWPNTEGYMMVLYPLAKMTGGVFVEHSHRLFGILVGLVTLALTVYLILVDKRWWLRALAVVLFLLVCLQGYLGGIRVTATSQTLAVVHGVLGQIFFALVVAVGAFVATSWHTAPRTQLPALTARSVPTDRKLFPMLLVGIILQLVLGAILRHFYWGLHLHITVGILIAMFAIFCGVRAKALYRHVRLVSRFGGGLMHLAGVQVLLGFAAWAAGGGTPRPVSGAEEIAVSTGNIAFTTIHQVTGALVLAYAVLATVWVFRLLSTTPAPNTPDAATTPATATPA